MNFHKMLQILRMNYHSMQIIIVPLSGSIKCLNASQIKQMPVKNRLRLLSHFGQTFRCIHKRFVTFLYLFISWQSDSLFEKNQFIWKKQVLCVGVVLLFLVVLNLLTNFRLSAHLCMHQGCCWTLNYFAEWVSETWTFKAYYFFSSSLLFPHANFLP